MPDGPREPGSRAVFLDRDGTIVEDPGFLHEPGEVRLASRRGEAIRQLTQAGWRVITSSNQSGIARGLYDEAAYNAVQAPPRRAARGAMAPGPRPAGLLSCPHHPDFTGPCECRKPGSCRLFREAAPVGLDVAGACGWVIGRRDVEPARRLGGRAAVSGDRAADAAHAGKARALGVRVVGRLAAAAAEIVRGG